MCLSPVFAHHPCVGRETRAEHVEPPPPDMVPPPPPPEMPAQPGDLPAEVPQPEPAPPAGRESLAMA